jgi:hypothetical protein
VLSAPVDLLTFFLLCRIWASHWLALTKTSALIKKRVVNRLAVAQEVDGFAVPHEIVRRKRSPLLEILTHLDQKLP